MRVPFLHSLPVRLAGLILLLSGVTLLILTEINRRAVERLLIEQAEVQAMLSTVAVVDGLDGVIGSAERLARTVARDLEGRNLTPAEVERLARVPLQDHPSLFAFTIAFEPAALGTGGAHCGYTVFRSNVQERYVTRDLATPDQAYWQRDWYREVVDKGVTVWSDPFFDQGGTDRAVVRVAVPIYRTAGEKRTLVGAVAAMIELDWLRRLANTNEFSDTAFTIIFARSGKLILHPRPNYAIAETMETLADKERVPELAAIRQSVLAKRQGTLSYEDTILKRRVHVNYKPTKVAGWGVVVGYEEEEFLKHQRAFRLLAAGFLGASLLGLAGIVIGVTRYALRPLGTLATATGEIARGNLDCEVPATTRADEIGALTRAFREMRDALKAQYLERRWASQALEHQLKYNNLIIDTIDELVFVVTKAFHVSRINPAVTRVAGYRQTDVLKTRLEKLLSLVPAAGDAGPANVDVLKAVVQAGESRHDLPATLVAKDGARLQVLLTLVPLRDANQVVGAVITLKRLPVAAQAPA